MSTPVDIERLQSPRRRRRRRRRCRRRRRRRFRRSFHVILSRVKQSVPDRLYARLWN